MLNEYLRFAKAHTPSADHARAFLVLCLLDLNSKHTEVTANPSVTTAPREASGLKQCSVEGPASCWHQQGMPLVSLCVCPRPFLQPLRPQP